MIVPSQLNLAVISESPFMTTGFGVSCRNYCAQLSNIGWNIYCFGVGFTGFVPDRKLPFKVWFSGRDSNDFYKDIPLFLEVVKPDLVLLIGDAEYYIPLWLEQLLREEVSPSKIIGHVVADGLPLSNRSKAMLSKLTLVLTGTLTLTKYLKHECDISSIFVPLGIDLDVFQPLDLGQKIRLRRGLGLEASFLIGIFGRNSERKQHPRIIEAVRILREKYKQNDMVLYMHCQPVDDSDLQGWNLHEVSDFLGVSDCITFPEDLNQLQGIELVKDRVVDEDYRKMTFNELSYIERIGVCDLVLNTPWFGGCELISLEAQACGIPIATINDGGSIAEIAGPGAILMDTGFGIGPTGAVQFLVAPDVIAQNVLRIKGDHSLRTRLASVGTAHVKQYKWSSASRILSESLLATYNRTNQI
jgi:glycosyltransferase involved in cell wall biosynthesis